MNGKIVNRILDYILYLYLLLPIVIFIIGWLKIFYSIFLVIVIMFCMYRVLTKNKNVFSFALSFSPQDIEKYIIAIIIIAFWVYLSGIGGLSFQTSDHTYRNAIYEMLVNQKWPVVGNYALGGDEPVSVQMVYYVGFWMPASVFGKMFGVSAGYYFQAIWAFIGIALVYFLMCNYFKDIKVWYLLVLVFFSGLDILGFTILRPELAGKMYYVEGESIYSLGSIVHLEWWCDFQFSSFTTQLFWVFNQAIPCWIAILLILQMKSNKYIVFILGQVLLCSPFPFVGMIPFAAYYILFRKYDTRNWKQWFILFFKDTFTIENVVGGGITGIISFLYLKANYSGQSAGTNTVNNSTKGFLMTWIIFLVVEIGFYVVLEYYYQKHNVLFYICFVWLAICPLFTVGSGQDFCMRASIPALFVLMLLLIDTLKKAILDNRKLLISLIVLVLTIGAMTPLHEINRSIRYTTQAYHNNSRIVEETVSDEKLMTSKNFSGYTEGDFFYTYLAR